MLSYGPGLLNHLSFPLEVEHLHLWHALGPTATLFLLQKCRHIRIVSKFLARPRVKITRLAQLRISFPCCVLLSPVNSQLLTLHICQPVIDFFLLLLPLSFKFHLVAEDDSFLLQAFVSMQCFLFLLESNFTFHGFVQEEAHVAPLLVT